MKFLECWKPDKKHYLSNFTCFSNNMEEGLLHNSRYLKSKLPGMCYVDKEKREFTSSLSDLLLFFACLIAMHHNEPQKTIELKL